MVDTNLEARGLYIPRADEPCAIPLLTPSLFSAAPESAAIFIEPPPGVPRCRSLFIEEALLGAGFIF
jgi:hypothetical protein